MILRLLIAGILSFLGGGVSGVWLAGGDLGTLTDNFRPRDRSDSSRGQQQLPQKTAQDFIRNVLEDVSTNCVRLPRIANNQKLYVNIDAMIEPEVRAVYAYTKHLEQFERAGIVTTTTTQHNPAYWFRMANVELSRDIDGGQLGKSADGMPCLIAGSGKVDRIVKIDHVRGGKTSWDGAIVLAQYKYAETPLYQKFLQAQGIAPRGTERKMRLLAKHDPVTGSWKRVSSDWAPLQSQDYPTNNVPNELGKD